MTEWLVVAPERADDDALRSSTWIAQQTILRAPTEPISLLGADAVRAALEQHVAATPQLAGVAFFGHGAEDRLFDAARAPGEHHPALLDEGNITLLRGRWIHAYACWSGKALASLAAQRGVAIYVGYCRPLDAAWECPPWVEQELVELVTCVTFALLAGERDERTLRARVSQAADAFYEALEAHPEAEAWPGWMWLHALSQQLVDHMIVVCQSPTAWEHLLRDPQPLDDALGVTRP